MKTLTVKLKQHTPLIHFQHNQYGATLRASEVKPKLDRFLLSSLNDINDEEYNDVADSYNRNNPGKDFDSLSVKEQRKEVEDYIVKKYSWLIGKGEHQALNYKMRISIDGDSNTEEYLIASLMNGDGIKKLKSDSINVLNKTPYFAQEKENTAILRNNDRHNAWKKIGKKGIIEKGAVDIVIVSSNDNLLEYISKHIQSFMLSTNFGTRQSKGFGSFTVVEIELNGKSVPLKEDIELLKNNFTFVYYKDEKSKCLDGIFRTINSDYRLIKSGATFPNYKKSKIIYKKSKIMLWANENGIGWDKKYIKSQFANVGCPYILKSSNPRQSFSEKDKYLYFRALLGLAEQFEFLLDNPPLGDSKNKLIVKVVNSEIKRYQSPLLFKVIGHRIYLVGNNVSQDILNKSFNFSASIMEDKQWSNFSLGALSTPSSSFILKDFIGYAMQDKSLGYISLK